MSESVPDLTEHRRARRMASVQPHIDAARAGIVEGRASLEDSIRRQDWGRGPDVAQLPERRDIA